MPKIPYGKALGIGYDLVMLDCPTRRSIISTCSHCHSNDLQEYSNKRWTIKYQGDTTDGRYLVTDNKTGEKYFVEYFDYFPYEPVTWAVYKKKEIPNNDS